ncbi:uncharacterized protein BT62DRAFT_470563 [Guyanagaster necrorhizus]|uniref:Uncharacterized protein n=1 Tax=Guyanagaster necrorhizus TaxID=856835 RepID=A0A9P7VJX5_9AGAR|nr:uncharacterized protein BT62DRAFT_470563 [Guyanagaster necrorhizus MCA 3950]KAG7441690.1 hypothetical protein BT62DRAFT_470563 [Guyanagaster necrorhizus MCA 3950]
MDGEHYNSMLVTSTLEYSIRLVNLHLFSNQRFSNGRGQFRCRTRRNGYPWCTLPPCTQRVSPVRPNALNVLYIFSQIKLSRNRNASLGALRSFVVDLSEGKISAARSHQI